MVHFSYFKRVLCVFLALALVFCMVTFPVAASSALALTATAILAGVAAGALIKALGLLVDYASDGWNTLVSDITQRWTERGYVQDGQVQGMTDGENVYFEEGMIEDTRDYLWESGMITGSKTNGFEVKGGVTMRVGLYGLRCNVDAMYYYLASSANGRYGYLLAVTTIEGAVFERYYSASGYTSLDTMSVSVDGVTYYYQKNSISQSDTAYPFVFISTNMADCIRAIVRGEVDFSADITVADGYEAGYIAGREQGLADGYAQWAENSVADDTTVYYPVYVGTQEEIAEKTQEEIWQGGTSMELEEDLSVGSLSDFLAALKSFLATKFAAVTTAVTSVTTWLSDILTAVTSIPAAISAAIADFFTPSAELDTYTIGLRDFFPFCIPFDIYDMLNAFRAEPVTPRWDLEFDFGELGTFPFTVDFAPWDELAQIVRTFEVVLFCVGLAAASKKLLGW